MHVLDELDVANRRHQEVLFKKLTEVLTERELGEFVRELDKRLQSDSFGRDMLGHFRLKYEKTR